MNSIIIGQILGDAHIEKIKTNCRMSFSFGSCYQEYGNWIYSLFSEYCSRKLYTVVVTTKDKMYTNYRIKTKRLPLFTDYHNQFYQYDASLDKYRKVIPRDIQVGPICLAHFIMGDGNYYKDGRIRIYTNQYTFDECILLRNRIIKGCNTQCEVLFDRIGKHGRKQYILTIGKMELRKVQSMLVPFMHKTMLYRIGIT